MSALIVIPARMGSRRLPGKPLLEFGGRTLLEWVYERASSVTSETVPMVVSSDEEILKFCTRHRLRRWRTEEAPTGTHRCAALRAWDQFTCCDVIVNWQVDEPFVPLAEVSRLIVRCRGGAGIATLVGGVPAELLDDRNVPKVIVTRRMKAHWFSRQRLIGGFGHCGVYAFRNETLLELGGLSPTVWSEAEQLEQLAWIENGYEIDAVPTPTLPLSINTADDLEKARKVLDVPAPQAAD